MPSEPPTGPTPPPLIYPSPAERVGYRWGTGIIALIVAVILLIAVGITAAIVWNRGPGETKPPKLPDTGFVVTPTPTTQPGGGQPPAPPRGRPAFSLAVAESVEIGDGISLTLVPDWTIAGQDHNYLSLVNDKIPARMQVTVGKTDSDDIKQVLTNNIEKFAGDLTNLELEWYEPEVIGGTHFQQSIVVPYTAVVSTQQGTAPVSGVFVGLLNPSTRESAFIDLLARSEDDLSQAWDGARPMIMSMF